MKYPLFPRRQDLLLNALDLYQKENPDKILLADENNQYTAKKTFRIATSLSKQFSKYLKPEEKILVKTRRDLPFLLVFFGLRMAKIFVVLADYRDDIFALREEQGLKEVRYFLEEKDGRWVLVSFESGEEIPLSFTESDEGIDYVEDSSKPTFMIFTSGSTSKKKGVLLSEKSIALNSDVTTYIANYSTDDISMVVLPLNHIFGIAQVCFALFLRHSLFLPSKTDPSYLLDCIEKYHVTRMNGVPTIYLEMAEKQKEKPRDVSSLVTGFIGGGPSLPAQLKEIESVLPLHLLPVYGMSECLVITCSSYFDDDETRRNSLGKPYSTSDVRIEDGEIILKSPYLFSGYADKKPYLDENGYFHTGDLGRFDENGYLHLQGRKKDIIIRNGNNISAFWIEQSLAKLPEVEEACVVPHKDDLEGEVPFAYVVLKSPISEEKICAKLKESLPKNMIPKEVVFLRKFPRTYSGKIDKLCLQRGTLDER